MASIPRIGAAIVGGVLLTALFAACGDPYTTASAPTSDRSSTAASILLTPSANTGAASSGLNQLSGHLTPKIIRAPVVGNVELSKVLTLTLGLGVKDPEGLQIAAKKVSDPRSPRYRKYVTPEQFADRYGATIAEYQKVVDWAKSNNLTVVTHRNRLAADASGAIADIESAFHVRMRNGLRPDGSQFYAPDTEPSIDVGIPLEHVSNLENYILPRPATGGSGPAGSRTGLDFRNAYVPGTTLTGTGQSIGIYMQTGDGFLQSDVNDYFKFTSISALNLPTPTVSVIGAPITGVTVGEGDLDVQMALSMAPSAQVVVFTNYDNVDTSLSNMADNPEIKQLSMSAEVALDQTGITEVTEFALQGQSFFVASGDYPDTTPCVPNTESGSSSDLNFQPWVTTVGGTGLNMTGTPPATVKASEVPWQPGETAGLLSGSVGGPDCWGGTPPAGGIPIPMYQLYALFDVTWFAAANGASSVWRNTPDVAAEAFGAAIYKNAPTPTPNLPNAIQGGTSVATPLWAGFLALANQAATEEGVASIGFANPALYSLYNGSIAYGLNGYDDDFNDIVSSTNQSSQYLYTTGHGYDLVTGLGSPRPDLIWDLALFGSNIFYWNGGANEGTDVFSADAGSACATSIGIGPNSGDV